VARARSIPEASGNYLESTIVEVLVGWFRMFQERFERDARGICPLTLIAAGDGWKGACFPIHRPTAVYFSVLQLLLASNREYRIFAAMASMKVSSRSLSVNPARNN